MDPSMHRCYCYVGMVLQDLMYIYGRYIDSTSEVHTAMYVVTSCCNHWLPLIAGLM